MWRGYLTSQLLLAACVPFVLLVVAVRWLLGLPPVPFLD